LRFWSSNSASVRIPHALSARRLWVRQAGIHVVSVRLRLGGAWAAWAAGVPAYCAWNIGR
jgi:hypothetical protein